MHVTLHTYTTIKQGERVAAPTRQKPGLPGLRYFFEQESNTHTPHTHNHTYFYYTTTKIGGSQPTTQRSAQILAVTIKQCHLLLQITKD